LQIFYIDSDLSFYYYLRKSTAALENSIDQRYRPYSSGISAPGRNFILALKVGF